MNSVGIAHDGAGGHVDEGRNSVAVLESVLDMQDFVVEFTDLFLQNLVIGMQPILFAKTSKTWRKGGRSCRRFYFVWTASNRVTALSPTATTWGLER